MSSTLKVNAIQLPDGTRPTAADLGFAGGSVIQTVQGTTSTGVSQNTASNVDTTLSASITPSSTSSKILITVSQHGLDKRTDNAYMELQLHADGTSIYQPNSQLLYNNSSSVQATGSAVFSFLHSPSTTSQITYKTVFRCPPARNSIAVQYNNSTSTIILQEIAG